MLETNENTFRFVLLLARTNLIIFTCVSLLERNSYFNFEDSRVTQRRDEGNETRGEEERRGDGERERRTGSGPSKKYFPRDYGRVLISQEQK